MSGGHTLNGEWYSGWLRENPLQFFIYAWDTADSEKET